MEEQVGQEGRAAEHQDFVCPSRFKRFLFNYFCQETWTRLSNKSCIRTLLITLASSAPQQQTVSKATCSGTLIASAVGVNDRENERC